MLRLAASIVCLPLAAALAGCKTEFENPFANPNVTVAPRPDAAMIFTGNTYTTRAGAPRDLFAAASDGSAVSRLTFCNTDPQRCDTVEAAPGPDRRRVAVRRVTSDTNGDGRLTAADGESLVIVDLSRSVEGALFSATARISGIDWSPREDILVYSAVGEGGLEDLFRTVPRPDPNETRNLTASRTVRERRPRIDPTGSVAVFERIDATGKGQVWIFNSSTSQVRVTSGGPGSEGLPGTPYVVGSDADPDYSPDGRSIVFRRLTGTGNGGLGTWDLLMVRTDGTGLAVIVTGPAYRGPPDWGPEGILFEEVDVAEGASRIVVVQPDGSGRRALVTAARTATLSSPRWLP